MTPFKRTISFVLVSVIAGCNAVSLPTSSDSGVILSTTHTATMGASVEVRIDTGATIKTQAAKKTIADVHHYHLVLINAVTGATVAEGDVTDLVSFFHKVPNGTYKVRVDALDAAGTSIVQGGAQDSSNSVTVASPNVTYSDGGPCLKVRLKLLNATGEKAGTAITVEDGDDWVGQPELQAGGSCACPMPTPTPTPSPTPTPLGCFGLSLQPYVITGFLGSGSSNADGTPIASASTNLPSGLVRDSQGNLFYTEGFGNRLMMVPAHTGTYFGKAMVANCVYTIAGTGTAGYSGDGGPAVDATLSFPQKIDLDNDGNILLADTGNSRIRVIARTDGTYFGTAMVANSIYTIDGPWSAGPGGNAGTGSATVDAQGNLYVVHRGQGKAYMVPKASGTYFGIPMTANTATVIANLGAPNSIAIDQQGNVLISDFGTNKVIMLPKVSGTFYGQTVTANQMTAIVGTGLPGFAGDGGNPAAAQLNGSTDIQLDRLGNLFIADHYNNRLRMVPTVDGSHYGVAMSAGNIYTIVGTGQATSTGDGGPALSATINGAGAMDVDQDGNIFVCDVYGNRVRFISGDVCTP